MSDDTGLKVCVCGSPLDEGDHIECLEWVCGIWLQWKAKIAKATTMAELRLMGEAIHQANYHPEVLPALRGYYSDRAAEIKQANNEETRRGQT